MTVVFEFFRDLRSSRVASLDMQQTMACRQMGVYACVLWMLTVVGNENPKAEALYLGCDRQGEVCATSE